MHARKGTAPLFRVLLLEFPEEETMRKGSLIFSLVLVFTVLLSACAGGNNGFGSNTGYPAPGGTETQPIPNTGITEGVDMNTPTVDSTPAVGVTEAIETATQAAAAVATEEDTEETTPTNTSDDDATTPTADSGGQTGSGQGNGVIGIPQTGSGGYVGLAAMTGWQVVGADGSPIGTVQDYVVNTCEAHILYLVVDASETITAQGGQQILIPFEAVLGELNEGSSVSVDRKTFTLKQNAADLMAVPGVDIATADLENPNWSESILIYWEDNDYLLSRTAGCPVPVSGEQATPAATMNATQPEFDATPTVDSAFTPDAGTDMEGERQTIYRLALAGKLLNARLQEGNGRLLGTVQDIAIVPETGRTQFYVVDTAQMAQATDRMVALPPGAVNISYENSANQPVVVLLVETSILQDAPDFDEGAGNSDGTWFNYWNQHIPVTREAMP